MRAPQQVTLHFDTLLESFSTLFPLSTISFDLLLFSYQDIYPFIPFLHPLPYFVLLVQPSKFHPSILSFLVRLSVSPFYLFSGSHLSFRLGLYIFVNPSLHSRLFIRLTLSSFLFASPLAQISLQSTIFFVDLLTTKYCHAWGVERSCCWVRHFRLSGCTTARKWIGYGLFYLRGGRMIVLTVLDIYIIGILLDIY